MIAERLNKNKIFIFIYVLYDIVYSIFNLRPRTPSGTRADHSLGNADLDQNKIKLVNQI